jgi:hypothetical protein
MDAGNELGPEEMASLVPALEKMTQLTSLGLSCARIRFWARPRGVGGVFFFGAWCWVRAWMRCAVLEVRALRAGDASDGLRGVCLSGGRRWMQSLNSGVSGIRRSWRRCRSSPRSTSMVRGFAFLRGLGGFGGSLSLVRGVGYALGCGVKWLGYALESGRCVRRIARCVLEGAGGDGCRRLIRLGRELSW